MKHDPTNEWDVMMKKVAAFHHKHDFAGQNGHDMGYEVGTHHRGIGRTGSMPSPKENRLTNVPKRWRTFSFF